MTDLSQMSNTDLMTALNMAPDVGHMVQTEATRQGVDPALALAVARQESGLDQSRTSPRGAVGVMQLMPGTAGDLGVDPSDLGGNIRGGVTYLKQQLDRFQDPRLALAAYNAGPGAVASANGVPNFPETQKYVNSIMPEAGVGQMSNADLMKALGMQPEPVPQAAPSPQQSAPVVVVNPENGKPYSDAQQRTYAGLIQSGKLDPNAAPGSEAFPRGLWDPNDTPKPGEWYVDQQGVKRQAPGSTVAQDIGAGFMRPLQAYGHEVMNDYRAASAEAKAGLPGSPGEALGRMGADFASAPGMVMGAPAAAIGALTGAITRPIAHAAADVLPTPYAGPELTIQNGNLALTKPRPLDRVDTAQGILDTALSSVRPALGKGVPLGTFVKPTPAMTVDELRAAKNAAYAKVDQSGFAFPQADVQKLSQDVATEVARKGGPSGAKLYPASNAVSDRLAALAQQPGGVPLTQLDELRSDIYDALVKPGDRESTLGSMMRQKIDGLINSAQAPDIGEARDLNTRYMKAKAVTDKLDSAGLRSASTYSGGNYNNAVRQNLRPLVDPTSAQRINNLTSAEQAALRQAVTGTSGQNATRYLTKLLTNKMVQAPVALMTKGAGPAIMEAVGATLNKLGEKQTQGAVDRLLELIARGGKPAAASPASLPPLTPVPILSGRGLFGGTALARQLQARPSQEVPRQSIAVLGYPGQ